MNRRHFLRTTTTALGLAALNAPPSIAAAQQPSPAMSIARWTGSVPTDPARVGEIATLLTRNSIEKIGGMGRFVKKGGVVFVKPNIGFRSGPEQAANTHPEVVATIVRACYEAGAGNVRVGDNSCYGSALSYSMSGIAEAAKLAGAEVITMQARDFLNVDLKGDRLAEWPVYSGVKECDLLINVPVLKHHALTRVSSAIKNLMGLAGGDRQLWHHDLPTCLSDLAAFVRPGLTITDATRVLTRNGPTGGNIDDVAFKGVVTASTDIVAIEAFGAQLMGVDPGESRTMAKAVAKGLGTIDYVSLNPVEASVSS